MAENRNSRKKVIWVGLSVVCLLPILVCSGAVATLLTMESRAHAELEQRRKELFENGLPVDDLSMHAYYDSLTDNSKSAAWDATLTQFEGDTTNADAKDLPFVGTEEPPPAPTEPWPEKEQARAYLADREELLASLHALTDGNQSVRFPRAYDALNTEIREIQSLRQAARLLRLEHAVALHDGDVDRQFEAIDSQIGCALAIRQEPMIIPFLVSMALHGMALQSLQESLCTEALSKSQLEHIQSRLELFENYLPVFRRAFDGERYCFLQLTEDPSAVLESMDGQTHGAGTLNLLPIASDSIFYLDQIDRIQAIEPTTIQDFVHQSSQVDDELVASLEAGGFFSGYNHFLSSMMLPALGTVGEAAGRQVLQNRIALLAIQVRLYELQNDALPQSLDELTTRGSGVQIPKAADGTDFGYAASDQGATLWGYVSSEDRWSIEQTIPAKPPAADSPNVTESPIWYWHLKPMPTLEP